MARPACLYCGAPLPAETVAAAAASAATVASFGTRSAPGRGGGARDPRGRRPILRGRRTLGDALGLVPYESAQRRRRGGYALEGILDPAAAEEEAARLRAAGLVVFLVPESVARKEPVGRGGGEPRARTGCASGAPPGTRLVSGARPAPRGARAHRPPVSGVAARPKIRTARLEDGYRFHLHLGGVCRRSSSSTPATSTSARKGRSRGLRSLEMCDVARVGGRGETTVDDDFRHATPALGPTPAVAGGPLAAAAALSRSVASGRGKGEGSGSRQPAAVPLLLVMERGGGAAPAPRLHERTRARDLALLALLAAPARGRPRPGLDPGPPPGTRRRRRPALPDAGRGLARLCGARAAFVEPGDLLGHAAARGLSARGVPSPHAGPLGTARVHRLPGAGALVAWRSPALSLYVYLRRLGAKPPGRLRVRASVRARPVARGSLGDTATVVAAPCCLLLLLALEWQRARPDARARRRRGRRHGPRPLRGIARGLGCSRPCSCWPASCCPGPGPPRASTLSLPRSAASSSPAPSWSPTALVLRERRRRARPGSPSRPRPGPASRVFWCATSPTLRPRPWPSPLSPSSHGARCASASSPSPWPFRSRLASPGLAGRARGPRPRPRLRRARRARPLRAHRDSDRAARPPPARLRPRGRARLRGGALRRDHPGRAFAPAARGGGGRPGRRPHPVPALGRFAELREGPRVPAPPHGIAAASTLRARGLRGRPRGAISTRELPPARRSTG